MTFRLPRLTWVGKPPVLLVEHMKRVFGDLVPAYHVTQPGPVKKQHVPVQRYTKGKVS